MADTLRDRKPDVVRHTDRLLQLGEVGTPTPRQTSVEAEMMTWMAADPLGPALIKDCLRTRRKAMDD